MIVDFHVHSTASDGTCEPHELVSAAYRRGFAALAITDHDNADGAEEFRRAAAKVKGLKAITGIELSIAPGEGFDKFHLLGLGIDPASAGLERFLRSILEGRNERNRKITANFERLGIDIKPERHGEVLARPHYARWLVEHGFAASIAEAFMKYLLPDSPKETRCYEERYHPSQEEAFRVIHEAGGLCIMAHPKYWRKSGMDADMARELGRLKEAGLDGLEVIYQANTMEENILSIKLARETGLLFSAGSDFHGANKPAIPLGMEVEESYIAPLLERFDRSAANLV